MGASRRWVADLDLEKCFGQVHHDKRMAKIATKISDKRLRKLIRGVLTAGVMEGGLVRAVEERTPQGGPLSPLLSNIVPDELDRVRERTRQTRGVSIEPMADELARYVRGWFCCCGKCATPSVLGRLEQWPPRRPRSAQWKQWRWGAVRFGELRRRGVGKALAARTAGSAHGPWKLAGSPALHLAPPKACFDSPSLPRWITR